MTLVVTCTKQKTRPVREALQLRNVLPGAEVADRARAWLERLQTVQGELVDLKQLYAGDHWLNAKAIASPDLISRFPIRTWVCSAGYGLIPFSSRLQPYSATFSPRHPDAVSSGSSESPSVANALWWRHLTQWKGPSEGSSRCFSELAHASKGDFIFVVVSEVYLSAIGEDLEAAVRDVPSIRRRLAILCTGAKGTGELAPYLLPSEARLQSKAGGALASLNIRLARLLVEQVPPEDWSIEHLSSVLAAWKDAQPERARYDREPMSDEDVRQAILKAIREDPAIRPSRLLRRLRDSGRACEHKRFVRLFHKHAGEADGQRP
jgi:hypothetical protein